MTFDDRPPPPPPEGRAPEQDAMHAEARQRMMLDQRIMEARLEELKSYRQQREGRVSRVMNLFFVFAIAGGVAFLLDAKGYSPKVSIVSSIITLVVISAWWAYRKPYGA